MLQVPDKLYYTNAGSLPSLHRLQSRIASKKLSYGKASLSVCTQIYPHFYLALDLNFFYTMIFNQLFLKEIILIIKCYKLN